MKYEYKSLVLCKSGYSLTEGQIESLNEWFENGWEYVGSISSGGKSYPATGVVLRKIKEGKDLLP